jgi:hypothetical protein
MSPEPVKPPSPEASLGIRFKEFLKGHSLTVLSDSDVSRVWRSLEPRLRNSFLDDVAAAHGVTLELKSLAGATSADGAVTLLITAQDRASGNFMVPVLKSSPAIDGSAREISHSLADFLSHGAGILVNVREESTGSEHLHLGLDQLLSPSALQLDQDRFLARSGPTVIGSCLISAIVTRCDRPPHIESIVRWRPKDSDVIMYRALEEDGTRHFIKIAPSEPALPMGVDEIETVSPTTTPIRFPRETRHRGKVGISFEEFHLDRGFNTIDPAGIVTDYPNLKRVITEHLSAAFPGFREEWTLEFSRAVRRGNATAVLLNISDAALDSFVPGLTPESSVRDQSFSGLLISFEVTQAAPSTDKPPGIRKWLEDTLSSFRRPQQVMQIEIVGPVLSDEAWRSHVELLSRDSKRSLFFPHVARMIALDLDHHYDAPSAIEIDSIKPTRLSPDSSDSWDKLVLAVDHALGTHIVEVIRERTFGLIPSPISTIQQYFPRNHRQRKN